MEALLFAAAGVTAFLLRFDFVIPDRYIDHLAFGTGVWVVVKTAVFHLAGLHRAWWRFVSIYDVSRIAAMSVVAAALSAVVIVTIGPDGFPRSVFVLDLLLSLLLSMGIRAGSRIAVETVSRAARAGQLQITVIYGAGSAGMALLREIRGNTNLGFRIVGFIDDDPRKTGVSIHGLRVFGGGARLAGVAAQRLVTQVLVAIPSADGSTMTRILEQCHAAGLACKTIPGLGELIENNGLLRQVREVAVEDLLGRKPVRLEVEEITAKLAGKTVMVTGAGGSIGSELCRQIARFGPAALVAYDVSETALFHIESEIRRAYPLLQFAAEVGDVCDAQRLDEVLSDHRPAILYHAAAYKHVPMMERHVFQAIGNNVFGTLQVAKAALRHRVADFVMISSDKAVNPTNIMGATKRFAELVINAFQGSGASFVSVRFGNVLGSNGSVIPTFKTQIAAGGPVTVTHPEMRRYFMTIPEAAQLVLQASSMGRGGEIFVLEMGEAVKIVDLARNLILLSGLRPEKDIKIEFTGIRPGEKLYEELNLSDEETKRTSHEKIRIFRGRVLARAEVENAIRRLEAACAERDKASVLLILKELVPEYNPSHHILEEVFKPYAKFVIAVGGGQTAGARIMPTV
jgi:FlaA1/EpsC-like NDP-sugar epimerase